MIFSLDTVLDKRAQKKSKTKQVSKTKWNLRGSSTHILKADLQIQCFSQLLSIASSQLKNSFFSAGSWATATYNPLKKSESSAKTHLLAHVHV